MTPSTVHTCNDDAPLWSLLCIFKETFRRHYSIHVNYLLIKFDYLYCFNSYLITTHYRCHFKMITIREYECEYFIIVHFLFFYLCNISPITLIVQGHSGSRGESGSPGLDGNGKGPTRSSRMSRSQRWAWAKGNCHLNVPNKIISNVPLIYN